MPETPVAVWGRANGVPVEGGGSAAEASRGGILAWATASRAIPGTS